MFFSPRRASPAIADLITTNSTGSINSLLRRPRTLHQHVCMIPLQFNCVKRTFLVRFQETPNEACYKFFVDDVNFLPANQDGTLSFDLDNCYQSPLADQILRNLPMVEEVTVGRNFVTVRRVDDNDADAAVRYFAMKMGVASTYTSKAGETETKQQEAAAQRSAELQQRVMEAMREDVREDNDATNNAMPGELAAAHSRSKSSGGGGEMQKDRNINNSEQQQEEEATIDEAALRDLVLSTHWSELKLHVSALLTDHLFSGRPHVDAAAPHPHPDTLPQAGDSEVTLIVKELIATTIRPELQMDGGDIRFLRVEGTVMYVEMLGACRKCKSGKTTLRDLIERATRHWVPEIQEVREVQHIRGTQQQQQEKDEKEKKEVDNDKK
ncbi:Scaffold protein Nfu/NifU [Trypanosoma melophagium]|uniref:Scaffold protein Nfu/NifU n=1 Tax=Trypanosoma melophagium TaxID=715481 RepID=UPI00351A8B92|nr:Scaffold protein Nfu/NifU [Trypanosoma melophagium]